MLTFDDLTARRALIDESADLTALRYRLVVRARPVLDQMPPVPAVKALLSSDGGTCPDDGTALGFDPWSPDSHRCPSCQKAFSGQRHHAHWARAQHLWLAERAAHLATLYALTDDAEAGQRARELLAAYYDLYFELPNSDNVLGPSHLFFSTYLESIWILDYLAAAFLLRETNLLDEHDIECIDAIANEAATIIAEFNEGMSNRQTWNSAALTAIATWFGDEDLAVSSIEGRTGLLGHLADGFGTDGMWFEGENYHLFALRGLLVGLRWATTAGADLLADDAVAAHLGEALMAPANSSLPDLTFPARKDARYGVSLAHPAYIECWEAGYAMLDTRAPTTLASWLAALYQVAPRSEQTYDAYLHEAGQSIAATRTRSDLSWWALLTMAPALAPAAEPWSGTSRLMQRQGLAILRDGSRYLSLECGGGGSGHGHPDRLHLTLHAKGVHWLADPGTGSYTTRDLFWYRSTLAHNAPSLEDHDQPATDAARCEAFDTSGEWSWCAGRWNSVRRSLVAGPRWAIDIVHFDSSMPTRLDVPWHFAGKLNVSTDADWVPAELDNEFVGDAEMLACNLAEGVVVEATSGAESIRTWFLGDGELLRATGPGLPGTTERRPFYVRRTGQNTAFMISIVDIAGTITAARFVNGVVEVIEGDATTTVQVTASEAAIASGEARGLLAGVQPAPLPSVSFVRDRPMVTSGQAVFVETAPALDGSLAGFKRSSALQMNEEHQYFRSELPYPGPDELSATAYVNWSDDDLYVAIEVVKSGLTMRRADAPALNLDNEPEDINADGVQLYWRDTEQRNHAWLIRPAPGGALTMRPIGATPPTAISGAWASTSSGYRITVRIPCPHLIAMRRTERLGFDVVVNEMREDRVRRAGQLVWSGGPAWVYLRGDRHDPADFGELELVG